MTTATDEPMTDDLPAELLLQVSALRPSQQLHLAKWIESKQAVKAELQSRWDAFKRGEIEARPVEELFAKLETQFPG